jgi:hypothetical protein
MFFLINNLKSFSKVTMLLFLLLFVLNCSNTVIRIGKNNFYSGIKEIKDSTNNRLILTHEFSKKYQKQLPLIVTTGIIKKNNNIYTELIFSLTNTSPINFNQIVLANNNEQIWNWDVHKKYIDTSTNETKSIEKYITRVDIMTNVLSDFFKHEPITLTFIGDSTVNKNLEPEHIDSILKTIVFADKVPKEYLLNKI